MIIDSLPDLLSLKQACELLNCHPNTLRIWDRKGELVAIRFGSRGDRRYKREDILSLIGKNMNHNFIPQEKTGPSVIDLFSGCGGLSLGFEQAGFTVKMGIDNWEDAIVTFRRNHPHAMGLVADLASQKPEALCASQGLSPGSVDVVVGGPPCQGFSIAGKRQANDPRNSLYKAFVNFVDYLRPKAFVLENVPNLLSIGNGKIRDKIIGDFKRLGYNITFQILTASDYGVPQNRRRVIFVGLNNGNTYEFPSAKTPEQKVTTRDALSDLPEESLDDGAPYAMSANSEFQELMRQGSLGVFNHQTTVHLPETIKVISMVPDGGNFKSLPRHLWQTRKVNIAWTRMHSLKPSFTIDTGHNHHFHYEYNRVPTTRESARIQSFPDAFIFVGGKTSQLKQVGNAVPPLMAQRVAHRLLEYI